MQSLPIPGQELVNPLGRMILQSRQDVGEPSLWIDVVELGGLDQRIDGSGTATAFVGSGERPVVAADRNAAQRPLGGIIGHAEATIVQEPGECSPAIEAVLDRFGGLVTRGELAALLAQPSLQCRNKGPAALVTHPLALLGRLAVDLALDREECMDTFDCRDRDRRLVDPRQIKKLAPRMRPAGCLDDRSWSA